MVLGYQSLAYASCASNEGVVETILVEPGDVFNLNDEKENAFYHRWANRLHIETKEEVIRHQLLFSEDGVLTDKALKESERILRANKYIKEATVDVKGGCEEPLQVVVKTTDNWTLTPGVTFGRSGGQNKTGLQIKENNLFGKGKDLGFAYRNTVDRDSLTFEYHDPHVLGTRHDIKFFLQNNSDGEGFLIDYSLPFFEFDGRKSWGIMAESLSQELPLYDGGRVTERIGVKRDRLRAFIGSSGGRSENTVFRKIYGIEFIDKQFFATDTFNSQQDGHDEFYPFIEFIYLVENFANRNNFRTMGRKEDIPLGINASANLGVISTLTGSDNNYVKYNFHLSRGFTPFSNSFGLIDLNFFGYLGGGERAGERLNLTGEYFIYQPENESIYMRGSFISANNLQLDEQLLLGGSTLRGYPFGYQDGDRVATFSVEKRKYFDWYPLRMFQFGAAVFADVGSVWDEQSEEDLLFDVGLSLRMVPTRSSSGKVIHIDIAKPITATENIDSLQISVGTKVSF